MSATVGFPFGCGCIEVFRGISGEREFDLLLAGACPRFFEDGRVRAKDGTWVSGCWPSELGNSFETLQRRCLRLRWTLQLTSRSYFSIFRSPAFSLFYLLIRLL